MEYQVTSQIPLLGGDLDFMDPAIFHMDKS